MASGASSLDNTGSNGEFCL